MSHQKTLEEIWKEHPCMGGNEHWGAFWGYAKQNGFDLTDVREFLNAKTNGTFYPESIAIKNPAPTSEPTTHTVDQIEYKSGIAVSMETRNILIKPKTLSLKKIKDNMPLVSIIIPTYNREKLVVNAINSALNQSYKNIEIIVIDDGSTDNTNQIIQDNFKFIKKVKYNWKSNGGVGSALNAGIHIAKGDLIAWLSSDDYYDLENNKLIELSVAAHTEDKNLGLTYTDFKIHWIDAGNMTEHNSILPESRQQQLEEIIKQCYINGSTTVIKREVFNTIGMYNDNLKYGQDHDMWMRIVGHYKVKNITGYLLNYRQGKHQRDAGACAHGCRIESDMARERAKLLFEDNRPTVCAMICIKNEEKMVEKCINDLNFYVDKIVVFDDGSTDKTSELLKKYPKIVDYYYSKPKGNIRTEGLDRQYLLEMAQKTKCDWILFIDTDEVFEDRYKAEIFKEMQNTNINLYYYLEHNFWRSDTHYRVDELWFKGWFGRLFRNLDGLMINSGINEHCGGIPNNIPGAPIWYIENNSPKAYKSTIRVKHYGYADWNRVVNRYNLLMERDIDVELTERHTRYDRMLNEIGITLRPWGNHWPAYNYCKTDAERKAFQEKLQPVHLKNIDKNKLNILIICFSHDPAGVGWLLADSINRHTSHSAECIVRCRVPLTAKSMGYTYLNDLTKEDLQLKIKKADIVHFNQFHPFDQDGKNHGKGLDWANILKTKPFILHNHGGAVLLDTDRYLGELKQYDPPILLCTPLNLPLFRNSRWLPNVMPIYDKEYLPIERDWNANVKIAHKLFYKHADYVKGTKMLLEVVNEFLRDAYGYPVELIWYHDLTINECLNFSADCHMCIGTIIENFAGMTIWESLSKGQVGICRLDPLVVEHYRRFCKGAELPILNPSGMDEMAKMIINLCNNRKQLEELATESRQWIEKWYNPERVTKMWIEYYQEIINSKKEQISVVKNIKRLKK